MMMEHIERIAKAVWDAVTGAGGDEAHARAASDAVHAEAAAIRADEGGYVHQEYPKMVKDEAGNDKIVHGPEDDPAAAAPQPDHSGDETLPEPEPTDPPFNPALDLSANHDETDPA
ncbi:MAG TPA: hypothetical protein VFW46_14830 [Stellaceae bacterium]|nr:hypothetical protein [Stellaceae bacterium]